MKYDKYHGLGNDYIVIEPAACNGRLTVDQIRRICHRQCGLGADGILLGPLEDDQSDARVRIFNPDGSEAEKSGNGLRIFARFLWDRGFAGTSGMRLRTAGGLVRCRMNASSGMISLEMGVAAFDSPSIPVAGPIREVLNEEIKVNADALLISAAGIGNPHCVVFRPEVSEEEARRIGPLLECHSQFPARTNVQFVKVLDRSRIRIEIWERGAGYTLASGTSSAAAAAVSHRLGFCGDDITVCMPGGELAVHIKPDYSITITGPVVKVAEGRLHRDVFEQKLPG
jgi:diaminopimelate epimerase